MPTAPSTLRVYLFRHDRMGFSEGSARDMAVSSPRNKASSRGRAALANLAQGCKARLKGLGLGRISSEVALPKPAVPNVKRQIESVAWLSSQSPVPYEAAVEAMEARVKAIHEGRAPETMWLLEHPPLYTAGTSARPEELLEPSRLPCSGPVAAAASTIMGQASA